MSLAVIPIRDAVVTSLNGASLQPQLTAVAIYDIAFRLPDLTGGRLVVVPQAKSPVLLNRNADQNAEVKIDVAVQYKFTTPLASELDPYMKLSESIPDLFLGQRLPIIGAVCLAAEFPHGLFLDKHMENPRVFTSVVTLSFHLLQ